MRGTARLLFAYDIGLWVDLDRCEKSLAGADRDAGIRHARRAPADIRFDAPPVRLQQEGEAHSLRGGRTLPAVEMLVEHWRTGRRLSAVTELTPVAYPPPSELQTHRRPTPQPQAPPALRLEPPVDPWLI